MEDVLDRLPPSERSRFIREAISEKIHGTTKVIQGDTLTYNESPKGNTLYDFNVDTMNTDDSPPLQIIEKNDNIDLDDKLNDIGRMFD